MSGFLVHGVAQALVRNNVCVDGWLSKCHHIGGFNVCFYFLEVFCVLFVHNLFTKQIYLMFVFLLCRWFDLLSFFDYLFLWRHLHRFLLFVVMTVFNIHANIIMTNTCVCMFVKTLVFWSITVVDRLVANVSCGVWNSFWGNMLMCCYNFEDKN